MRQEKVRYIAQFFFITAITTWVSIDAGGDFALTAISYLLIGLFSLLFIIPGL